eukprot:m.20110 g.20110  ORF g.20110 m.20110 type:complete len:258 (-) comp8546_c0_seq1:24-797(-)
MSSGRFDVPTTSLVPVPSTQCEVETIAQKEKNEHFHVELSVVTQAQGSVYLEHGNTKVMAACYGPQPTSVRRGFSAVCLLDCDVKFSPFSGTKRRKDQPTDEDKEMSEALASALSPCVCLSKYPKSIIHIHVNVLEDAGNAFSSAVNAACLSLVDAGIEMFDLLAAATVTMNNSTDGKKNTTSGEITMSLMSSIGEITLMEQRGKLSDKLSQELIQQAVDECGRVHVLQQHFLTLSHTMRSSEESDGMDESNDERTS